MTGKRYSQLQSFKGNSSLASAQRSGDFEFKVMEVHVAGCIHAIVEVFMPARRSFKSGFRACLHYMPMQGLFNRPCGQGPLLV